MIEPHFESVLRRLGFFYVDRASTVVRAGHIPTLMIEVLQLDEAGQVIGGPYAELVAKISAAILFYDQNADEVLYGTPEMKQEFIDRVVSKAGLPRDLLFPILSQR